MYGVYAFANGGDTGGNVSRHTPVAFAVALPLTGNAANGGRGGGADTVLAGEAALSLVTTAAAALTVEVTVAVTVAPGVAQPHSTARLGARCSTIESASNAGSRNGVDGGDGGDGANGAMLA